MARSIFLVVLPLVIAGVLGDDETRLLKLNEIQVLGSQNSYHLAPPSKAYEFLVDVDKILETKYSQGTQQSHLTLQEQLETQNVLQLELDVYWDPNGGLYSDPVGANMPDFTLFANFVDGARDVFDAIGDGISTAVDAISDGISTAVDAIKDVFSRRRESTVMDEPGFKVMNLNDFDYNTNCQTLKECLEEVKQWSNNNTGHLPLAIFLEPKDTQLQEVMESRLSTAAYKFLVGVKILPVVKPPTIGKTELYALEREVLSIFGNDSVLTPDMVRGNATTLEDAVITNGWPLIDDILGKVLFVLKGKRDIYIEDSSILADRMFFTSDAEPGQPDAAIITVSDPTSSNISELVSKGYIVQTRADTVALNDSEGWMEAAIASGAQYVSTNYPAPQGPTQNIHTNGYSVDLSPTCNPVLFTDDEDCPLLTNGGWSEWSEWDDCTGTCGVLAEQSRNRECNNPVPANGGSACNETDGFSESQTCDVPCDSAEASLQMSDDEDDDGTNIGAIVGGIVGGLVGLLLILFLIFFLWRRRRQAEAAPDHVCGGQACAFCHSSGCQHNPKMGVAAPPPYTGDVPPEYSEVVTAPVDPKGVHETDKECNKSNKV